MFQQRIAQEGVIEVFTVEIRLSELTGDISIFTLGFNHGDGFEANEQNVVGKAGVTRFIFAGWPFCNRLVNSRFRARAFGEAQRFAVGLPARFTQLGVNQEATLFFAEI